MPRLLADIGGTNTRCALTGPGGPAAMREFANADFGGLTELLGHYLDGLGAGKRPTAAHLAVAAPIRNDAVQMTNIDWAFSVAELRVALALDELELLNDFEALAVSLPYFGPADLRAIGNGTAAARGVKAVLGPGTGLGVASLVPVGDGWQAVPGEGGHVTLAAYNQREAELIRQARERLGHCSAERLISGPGLSLIHALLHGGPELSAAEIGRLIDAGEPAAIESLQTMIDLLGTVAADLALTVGAFGGVYIAGGILPRYADLFAASGFRRRFEDKGRYRDYLAAIPTWLIKADRATLTGLNARALAGR